MLEKNGARYREVRVFGGNQGVQQVIADSASALAKMKNSGAEDDPERCAAYLAATLAHSNLVHQDIHHQLRESRIAGLPAWSAAAIKYMKLRDELVFEMSRNSTFGRGAPASSQGGRPGAHSGRAWRWWE